MTRDLVCGPAVPVEYVGVWKRALLRTPQFEDTTSQVFWMQTSSWHADIRIPQSRPACTGKTTLKELTRKELLGLTAQQGFSGTTLVEASICRWQRQYDYQPPSGTNDIGRMEFDGPDRVLEHGIEADYFEIWERMPGSAGDNSAIQLSADPLVQLLTAGAFFMLVRPRVAKLKQRLSLLEFAAENSEDEFRKLMDFEISFGTRSAEDGSGYVELSTLPWRQGLRIRGLPQTRSIASPDISSGRGIMAEDWARQIGLDRRS